MILDRSNCFGLVQIGLVRSNSFWKIQIILGRFKLDYFYYHFGSIEGQGISRLPETPQSDAWKLNACITIMPCPSMGTKLFWTVQIILLEYQSFWTGPICFGWVQIYHSRQVQAIKISPEKSNLNLTKIIWTRPNQFGPAKQFGLSKLISML